MRELIWRRPDASEGPALEPSVQSMPFGSCKVLDAAEWPSLELPPTPCDPDLKRHRDGNLFYRSWIHVAWIGVPRPLNPSPPLARSTFCSYMAPKPTAVNPPSAIATMRDSNAWECRPRRSVPYGPLGEGSYRLRSDSYGSQRSNLK